MNKCSKYESLFIFSNKENLEKHIAECDECKKEADEQQKVSELINEVKFYYYSKNRSKKAKLRSLCAAFLMIISLLSVTVTTNDDLMDTLKYGSELSAEDLGFPVDSYGLLMVDE